MTTHWSFSRVFERLKASYPVWDSVVSLPTAELVSVIVDAGLSNQKAPRIKSILKRIKDDFGKVTLDSLAGLPDIEIEA